LQLCDIFSHERLYVCFDLCLGLHEVITFFQEMNWTMIAEGDFGILEINLN